MAVKLTVDNFEQEVLKSQLPVLVDFWADWCGPCKMVGPVVEELSTEMEGKLKVAKLNVDEAPQLAMQYGAMSIPMFVVFRDGQPSAKAVGAMSKEQLKASLSL